MDFAPESVYVVSIVVEVGIMWSRIWLSGKAYRLPVKRYCIEVLVNAAVVATLSGVFAWWIQLPISHSFVHFVIVALLVLVFTGVMIYLFGLNRSERVLVVNAFTKIWHRIVLKR